MPPSATAKTFERHVLQSSTPVVVDFWAPWCGPCKAISPILDELSKAYADRVRVVKVNVDEEQRLAGQFGVRSIPTLIGFHGGKPVQHMVGFKGREGVEGLFEGLAARPAVKAKGPRPKARRGRLKVKR